MLSYFYLTYLIFFVMKLESPYDCFLVTFAILFTNLFTHTYSICSPLLYLNFTVAPIRLLKTASIFTFIFSHAFPRPCLFCYMLLHKLLLLHTQHRHFPFHYTLLFRLFLFCFLRFTSSNLSKRSYFFFFLQIYIISTSYPFVFSLFSV